MAYIPTQFEVDEQRERQRMTSIDKFGDAVSGAANMFEENRKRALDGKQKKEIQGIELAKAGASPEDIKSFQDGKGAEGMYQKFNEYHKSKMAKDQESAALEKEFKLSQIKKNNSYQPGTRGVQQTPDQRLAEYRAKKQADAEFAVPKEDPMIAYEKKLAKAAEMKEPSQSQWGAGGFAQTMTSSQQVLDELDGKKFDRSGYDNSLKSMLPEFMKDEDMKRYEQAKRSFINAKLRKESGAAIAASEFDSAEKQYFEQVGDTEAVKDQKRRLRANAINAMSGEAGDKVLGKLGVKSRAPSQAQSKPKEVRQNGQIFILNEETGEYE